MPDEPTPPRKIYALKAREFERVNAPVSAVSTDGVPAPSANHPAPGGNAAFRPEVAPPDARELARLAAGHRPLLSANAPANRPNDVHALLAGNHARAEAAGLNALAPQPRRRSKRRRDYWILLLGGNAAIVGLYSAPILGAYQVQCLAKNLPFEFFMLLRWAIKQPVLYAIPALGVVFYSAALTWVMFHLMEDH